ncbi:hypothetical protein [Bradyrhizobium elkanii]|uniref:hypothetical protein n=1 Tax=Bradyrhizobium elkanii TaxID=29448 RepID=UPI000A2F644B|nr:hypothetical protein [Bradyrhizobium elkanii]
MGMLPEAQQDWIVTVAIKKDVDDDEEYRQVTYAAAVADSIQAVQLTIEDSGANAPMLNFPLGPEMLQRLGLRPGELTILHDSVIDPITLRPRHH